MDSNIRKKSPKALILIVLFVLNGGAEVTKLELIINKFIEKVRTFEMFELGRMIDCINSRKIA